MKKECLFWLTVTVASVHHDVILLLWAFYNREHPGRKMRQRKKHIQHLIGETGAKITTTGRTTS